MASSYIDGRQAREAIALAAYNFIIKYRVGENKLRKRAIKATPRYRGSARKKTLYYYCFKGLCKYRATNLR